MKQWINKLNSNSMETNYYFLQMSPNNGPKNLISGEVVDYAKKRYNNCLVHARRLQEIVADLNRYADELKAKNKSAKRPKIEFVDNISLRRAYIYIEQWPIYCEKALKEILI